MRLGLATIDFFVAMSEIISLPCDSAFKGFTKARIDLSLIIKNHCVQQSLVTQQTSVSTATLYVPLLIVYLGPGHLKETLCNSPIVFC